jgi:cystathionine beta-lyase
MTYHFDEIVNRRNTGCLKYDFAKERGKPDGLLPLWIADMDFRVPPEVAQAVRKTAEHGIFGYSEAKEPYYAVLSGWFERYFNYPVRREWVIKTPGVVFALALAVRAFTRPGDAVLIQRPVYYPFSEVIKDNGREAVSNSLVLRNGRYDIDFEDFEQKVVEKNIRLFLLCSPHNPVGRVWAREELTRMGKICAAHGCTVISDEIHCDFVYPGRRHTVFSSLPEPFAQDAVICTSPTKSFNIAGLQVANIIIPNRDIKAKLRRELAKTGYSQLSPVGLAAGQSAYEYGAPWLDAARVYIGENLHFARAFLARQLPKIKLIEPDGTYLLWLDLRDCGIPPLKLERFITEKAGLWLDDGGLFGPEGLGFQRINLACPRETLKQALTRLHRAFAANAVQSAEK